MKGTFAENRPFIEHEYQNLHWIENSGMPVKKLQIALREYVDCNLSLPMPILRAKAFAFLLENVQIEINPHSLFCDKLNLGIDYSDYAGQDLFAMELYRVLLRYTKRMLPKTRIILLGAYLTHGTETDDKWDGLYKETAIRNAITHRLAAEFGTEFLDLQKLFDEACKKLPPEHWTQDGVHPTAAGHRLLANAWENKMQTALVAVKK